MKLRYIICIIGLLVISIIGGIWIYFLPNCSQESLRNAFQMIPIFMAGLALVLAFHGANPRKPIIKFKWKVSMDSPKKFKKSGLQVPLRKLFDDYPEEIETHRVYLDITNTSMVDLKKPVFLFSHPKNRRHPIENSRPNASCRYWDEPNFNSNVFNDPDRPILDMRDTMIMVHQNLPFFNQNQTVTFWFRMALNINNYEPFDISVSINSDNAEGTTKAININPKEFLISTPSVDKSLD